MNGQLNIETLYAFVVRDDDNTEGVIGMSTASGWMPFVGADLARVNDLKPYAQQIATRLGKTVTLAVFQTRQNVEVIEP